MEREDVRARNDRFARRGRARLRAAHRDHVAAAIEEYGPDRVLVETDCANVLDTDVFSVKRTILELYRLGIDIDDIRQVVFENPRSVYGLAD